MKKDDIDWDLLAKFVSNEASETERMKVSRWVLEGEANNQVLQQIRKGYMSARFTSEKFSYSNGLSYLSDKLQHKEEASRQILERKLVSGAEYRPKRPGKRTLGLMISVMLLLALSLAVMLLSPDAEPAQKLIEKATVAGQKAP